MKTELETLKLNQKVVLPRNFDVSGHLVYPILMRASQTKKKLKNFFVLKTVSRDLTRIWN